MCSCFFFKLKTGVNPGCRFSSEIPVKKGMFWRETVCFGEVVAVVVSSEDSDHWRQLLPVIRCLDTWWVESTKATHGSFQGILEKSKCRVVQRSSNPTVVWVRPGMGLAGPIGSSRCLGH